MLCGRNGLSIDFKWTGAELVMKLMVIKIASACRLGLINILRIFYYRAILRFGLKELKVIKQAGAGVGPFYYEVESLRGLISPSQECTDYGINIFGLENQILPMNRIPLWHRNVLTNKEAALSPWWELPDFIDGLGDIKGVWEVSRLEWALKFALEALNGKPRALLFLNSWLVDWCDKNPPYVGVNWKCGQEASIRVIHLVMAAHLLGQTQDPCPELLALIRIHLSRIAPTVQYAIAQDNNHGTSEAAALFIGGSWLLQGAINVQSAREAKRWMKQGRKWLENRARRLIEPDGSFSQYSLNYHRLMLDTYAIAELWRRSLGLPEFSSVLVGRLQAATAWLGNMLSPDGSDAPNLGANDGARLLPLSETDYRDVRPSVQLASVLFSGFRAYETSGVWDDALQWLRVEIPDQSTNYLSSRQYDDGGFAVLRDRSTMALFRYPRFRFRPGQSDLLHVDFWLGAVNLLRDAGSFSYNCEEPWQSYFPSSAAHNTVQFDGRDAMPRLSRFLFGAWPKSFGVENLTELNGCQSIAAGYCDWKGSTHHRRISLTKNCLVVTDEVAGFERSAVLRWRLAPGHWYWEGEWLVGHECRLRVLASQPIVRVEIVEGWESRYYSRKTPLPVLEVEVEKAGTLTTELRY